MEYMLLEIQDKTKIDGETALKDYGKHIEVLSYSHNLSNPVQMGTSNTGRTTGRPNIGELVVTKQLDVATPALNYYCAAASDLGSVKLKLVRQDAEGKNNVEYMVYELNKAIVSSVSVGGCGDIPMETVSFNFTKLTWTYTVQKKDVGPEGQKPKWWDQETNTGG